ncbi:MAG: flagellar protein export ATPase FliI [Bdellovibrionales bacterium]
MTYSSKQTISQLQKIPPYETFGEVTKLLGLMIEIKGFGADLTVGSRVTLHPPKKPVVPCEVIGFRETSAVLLPFGNLEGVGLGCKAVFGNVDPVIYPSKAWLGRVINGLGEPIDGKGPLIDGQTPVPIRNTPPPAHQRKRIGPKLDLGIRAVNTFTSLCEGQRMGIFAGSGVGKSVLLSMMAKYTQADISVIGLIGERGREVQEFLEDDLGEEGLKRSVVIVATGDEPALMRRQAAYITLSTAEYFRKQQQQVLCLMDSVTRFAMAQREIGLSAGEPPTAKGYPPTTFGELSRLLERAGPGIHGEGDITGLFSVLVEGDDENEPISDAVRGILDGHIMMQREIAERGRYPAINVLKSISRSLPMAFSDEQNDIVRLAKKIISTYEDMAELIRLGAYRKGSDPQVDHAIEIYPAIEEFLSQNKNDSSTIDEGFEALAKIIGYSPNTESDEI